MNAAQHNLPNAGSDLERAFESHWRRLAPDAPMYVREYSFSTRRWRFDFAWPAPYFVAVELEGGVWSGGRHTRGSGFSSDAIKYNAATAAGWAVLRFTSTMLNVDPDGCIQQVLRLLEARS